MARFLFPVLLSLAALGCDGSHDCTLVGCTSGLALRVDSPVSEADLGDALVELCVNARCSEASLSKPSEGAQGYGSLQDSEGKRVADVFVMTRDGNLPWLDVVPWLHASEVADGDVYRLTVTSADGKQLMQLEHTIQHYEANQPNGPDCGPVCKSAVADLRKLK